LLPDAEPENLDISNDAQDLPQEISDGLLRQVTQELAAVHAKSNNFILFSEVRDLPSLKGLSRDSQDRVLNILQVANQIEMHALVDPGEQLPEVLEQGIPQIQGGHLFSLSIYNQFERHTDAALKAHFNPLIAEIQVAEASGKQLTGEDFSQLASLEHKLQQMPEALREYYSSTMLTKLQEMGALTILDASTGEPLQNSNLDVLSNSSIIKTLSYSPENKSKLSAARASEQERLPQEIDTELAAQITELRAREAVFGIHSEDFVNVLLDKAGLHKEETQHPEAIDGLAAEPSDPDVEGIEPTAGTEIDKPTEAEAISTEAIDQSGNEGGKQNIGGATGGEDVEKAKAILAIAQQAFIYQANNGQLVRDADVVSAHGHHYNLSYHEPTGSFIVSGTNENSLSIIGAEEDEGFKIYGGSKLEDTDIERFNTTSHYLERKSFYSDQPLGKAITSQSIASTTALNATNNSSGRIVGSELVRQALKGIVINIPESGLSAKQQQFRAWLKAEQYT
ncbi:MAG: hypothetical protein ABG776_22600, partial [Cyanobacteria bacterium J06555_13]